MKLIFIRHTSVAVPKGVCYGQTDVPLADSFDCEAAVVSQSLRSYNFDMVYSSPSNRCLQLARYCGFENPCIDARLMEMNFGDWEMKRYDEITDPRLEQWYSDFLNVRATGGESSMDQRNRFLSFIRDIEKLEAENVAVFTHGGIIIHALTTLGGLDYEAAFSLQPSYGAVIELDLLAKGQ